MNDMHRIPTLVGRLWMGDWPNSREPLDQFNLVVNAAQIDNWSYPRLMLPTKYIELNLWDDDGFDDKEQELVRDTARQIVAALGYGAEVLVHCHQGWNRSGLVVARTLMFLGIDPETAIEVVKKNRHPMALTNPTFTAWLMREGPSLQSELAAQEEKDAISASDS